MNLPPTDGCDRFDIERVTRFEVIDESGRTYVRDHRGPVEVSLSFQDGGRTLKVFVKARVE